MLFDSVLSNSKLEEAWIVNKKNGLLVCIFRSGVEPKVLSDFEDPPLPSL